MKKRSLNKIKQMVSIGMSCIMAGSTCNLPMMSGLSNILRGNQMQRKAHFQNLTAVKSLLVQFTYTRQLSRKPTKMATTIFCQKKQFCQRSIKVGRVPRPQELRTAWAWRLHTCTKCGHSYTEELAKLPSQTNQADQTNQIEPANNGNEKDFIGTVTSVFLNVTNFAAKNFRISFWHLIQMLLKAVMQLW